MTIKADQTKEMNNKTKKITINRSTCHNKSLNHLVRIKTNQNRKFRSKIQILTVLFQRKDKVYYLGMEIIIQILNSKLNPIKNNQVQKKTILTIK